MNGNIMINVPDAHRAQYLRVQEALAAQGADPGRFTIQEADLRLEALLSPLRTTYQLNLYEVENAGRPLELRLNRNDMYFVRGMALCVTRQDAVADPEQYGNYPLWTYPDPNYFNGSVGGAGTIEASCLENIWNGKTSFITQPTTRIQSFLNFNFRYVPELLYTESAINYAGGPPTNPTYPSYGPTDEKRGFFMFGSMPVLYGSQNNQVQIELGQGDVSAIDGAVDSAGSAVDTRNVLVCLLKGFKVQNGAELATRWVANGL